MRRLFLWINFALASLIVLLVFLQAYFITAYVAGAGESALDAHSVIGFLFIHAAEALVFLTAFGAWPRAWKWIGFTFFLFALGTVQILLTPVEERTNGWLHGLHGLLALVVAVTAAVIARRGMRDLGLIRSEQRAAASSESPPPRP
jgi:hypothetical protein